MLSSNIWHSFLSVMSEEEWCNVKDKYVAGILL